MILITLLIVAIFFATWVKDGKQMNPPFSRRAVVDLTVIVALWLLYGVFYMTQSEQTAGMASVVIDLGLWYFVAQFVWLIGSISPMFKGLVELIKKKGINVPELEVKDEDKTEGEQ